MTGIMDSVLNIRCSDFYALSSIICTLYLQRFCIAGEEYDCPRVTLRLHQIKTRDEKGSSKFVAVADVASFNNNRQDFHFSC
jgi:hypothetical protein